MGLSGRKNGERVRECVCEGSRDRRLLFHTKFSSREQETVVRVTCAALVSLCLCTRSVREYETTTSNNGLEVIFK